MYAGKKVTASEINFLDSEKFVSLTQQADSSTTGVVNGVLPAGSIYPNNDATAIGVTINDVDVSEGPQPVGVIVEGYVNAARLPVKPVAAAITALKEIKFSHVSD